MADIPTVTVEGIEGELQDTGIVIKYPYKVSVKGLIIKHCKVQSVQSKMLSVRHRPTRLLNLKEKTYHF